MIYMGSGNTGGTLAYMADENALIFSTATQDTNNFPDAKNVFVMAEEGASKRFKQGEKIWMDNEKRLRDIIKNIKNEKVVIFSSLGGGSGSSSLQFLLKYLTENSNKILVVGVLPFKKEINPPLANAVQSVNSIMPYINKASVMMFDNNDLIKQYENDWVRINNHIVNKVDHLVNLINKYSLDGYSPLTLDQSELESVVFGGGFVDLSMTFIENVMPKFEYGSLDKKTKNCMIAMFVDESSDVNDVNKHHNMLTGIINKLSSRIPNSRMIPGIVRCKLKDVDPRRISSVGDRCFITVASGLSVEKYMSRVEKMRDDAIRRAEAYSESDKFEKFFDNREAKKLDI